MIKNYALFLCNIFCGASWFRRKRDILFLVAMKQSLWEKIPIIQGWFPFIIMILELKIQSWLKAFGSYQRSTVYSAAILKTTVMQILTRLCDDPVIKFDGSILEKFELRWMCKQNSLQNSLQNLILLLLLPSSIALARDIDTYQFRGIIDVAKLYCGTLIREKKDYLKAINFENGYRNNSAEFIF